MRVRPFVGRAWRRSVGISVVGASLLLIGGCADRDDVRSQTGKTTSVGDTDVSAPAPTLRSSAAASAPTGMLPHYVIKQQDVSAGSGVHRLSLAVVVPVFPVTRQQMINVAMATIQARAGQGWQAIRLTFAYDPAEAVPAYGVAEWAPAGNWQDTTSTDANTWDGYQLNQEWSGKVDHPAGCHAPTSTAFGYAHEYRTASGSGASDQTVFASIAAHHDVSPAAVAAAVNAVEAWSIC